MQLMNRFSLKAEYSKFQRFLHYQKTNDPKSIPTVFASRFADRLL